jgi:argininosuccinate lyase
MRAAITPECFATDRAVELTAGGMPFRDAYKLVASELDQLQAGDADASLTARTSPGGPGALDLSGLRSRFLNSGEA